MKENRREVAMVVDPKSTEVVPTIENVDYNRYYVYYNSIPEFGMFEEEKYKYDPNHEKALYKDMMNGKWEGDVKIEVDINTYNITLHNHTYFAAKRAIEDGFNMPLKVTYVNASTNKKDRLRSLLKDEWTKKFNPNGILMALMNKNGEEPNSANKVYDYCMGHPYLRGKGDKSFKLGMAFICLFGESKPFMKQLKKVEFNPRNTKVDYTSYDLLDKAIEIRNAASMKDTPAGMESFLRMWYKFYNESTNYSYLNVGGWKRYLSNVSKVVNAMGGVKTIQDDEYNSKFFQTIMLLTKGNKTLKSIAEDYENNAYEAA